MSEKFKPNFNRSESSLFAPRYNTDPTRCEHHIEAIKHLIKCCELELTIEDVWHYFDNLEFKERLKTNSKKKKRLNKKDKEFKPVDIKKPMNTLNIHRARYRKENENYNADDYYVQYKYDKDNNTTVYQECAEEAKRQKEEYTRLVSEQKEKHIYNGLYVPKPPKSVCNDYIILTNAFRNEDKTILNSDMLKDLKSYKLKLKKQYKNDVKSYNLEFMKSINVISKKYWDKLGGKEHSYQPLKDAKEQDLLRYRCQKYEYDVILACGKVNRADTLNEEKETNNDGEYDDEEFDKLTEEYKMVMSRKPDGYDEYILSDDYKPLYNFPENIDID